MKTKRLFLFGLSAFLLALSLGLAGCDDLFMPDENGNKPYDTTKTYAFYNNSSYTVTLWDSTGSHELDSGDSGYGRFDNEISIDDVYYSPSNTVKVTKSGSTSFTFTDK
ncbi:MAG: hypothetical protein LBK61_12430 [Spirochaetaceae bacterium]|jgi:hypothetical protein|nr:hypothetical protein [Spirochaetaceae bacterium]